MKRLVIPVLFAMFTLFPTKSYAFDLLEWLKQILTIEITINPERNDIISAAKPYQGYQAKTHRNELKVMMKIDPVTVPWCAGFMNYILDKAGYEHTDSLLASSYHAYGTKVKSPERGDVVILKRNGGSGRHVGFFYGFVDIEGQRYIQLLGGNQDKSVKVSEYPTSKVVEYRRPIRKN